MPYEYFEVTAEIGVRAWENSTEMAFIEAARALFDLMVDINKVQPLHVSALIQLESDLQEILLADWLNQLIVERDRKGMVFSQFEIFLESTNTSWKLIGFAKGEKFDRLRHDSRTDVKAVTYNNLVCKQEGKLAYVECVLDI